MIIKGWRWRQILGTNSDAIQANIESCVPDDLAASIARVAGAVVGEGASALSILTCWGRATDPGAERNPP